ncbi:MAG: hypothetical protein IPM60_17665 [Rhodospirillales bacterium]|nr:hypothetical protein [Rhodospirillales bacterium]
MLFPLASPCRRYFAGRWLGAEDRHQIERLERYSHGLGTLQSRFLQVSSNGELVKVTFTRGGRGGFRIDYDPPVPDRIIANNGLPGLLRPRAGAGSATSRPTAPPAGISYFSAETTLSFDDPELTIPGFEHDDTMLRITIAERGPRWQRHAGVQRRS